MQESTRKSESIMLMNVISMLAVVYLHSNNCFWTFSTDRYWKSANIIEAGLYFAVPCFFMITGANLLDYRQRYDTKTFLIKRAKKTVFPYIFWSFIGIGFNICMHNLQWNNVTIKYVITGLVNGGSIVTTYWFFMPLYAAYLAIPLFSAVEKEKRKSVYVYISVVGFLLNVLIPFAAKFTDWVPYNPGFRLFVNMSYLFYVVVGWLLHTQEIKRKNRIVIYVLAILGLLTNIIGTYFLSMRDGTVNKTFNGYNDVPCILYAIGVFVLIKQIAPKIMDVKWIRAIVVYLNKYTFGVYLLHWSVLKAVIRLTRVNEVSLIWRLLSPIGIVAVCVAIIWVIRKIPVLKHVVP